MVSSPFRSFLYRSLLGKPAKLLPAAWKERALKKIESSGKSLRINLHGRKAFIPAGYSYPVICRNNPSFNNPLLQLAWQVYKAKNEKIRIIDAGAAIGDTILFLKQNMPSASTDIYCIEGDSSFYNYLAENADGISDSHLIQQVLSSAEEWIPALVHHHSSSSISSGKENVRARRLDLVWQEKINSPIDMIKIDVDGFDGRILAGATGLLQEFSPAILFEFHPMLIKQCGNELLQPFNILKAAGYDTVTWFDKFGNFLTQKNTGDQGFIDEMVNKAFSGGEKEDIHFDIIAPGNKYKIDPLELAACKYAKAKKYPY